MKKHLFLSLLLLLTGSSIQAQTLQLNRTGGTVAVGSDGTAISPSAVLDVKSTTQGVLLPRLTTAQRTAIANPANGLLVFDSDTQGFWFRQNGAWVSLSGGGGSVGWQQTGNNLTNTNSGNVGIGSTNPLSKLSVNGDGSFSGPPLSLTTVQISGGPLPQFASRYTGGGLQVSNPYSGSSSSIYVDGSQVQALNYQATINPSLNPESPSRLILNPFGGDVGIGTGSDSPGARLHIRTPGEYALRLEGSRTLQTFNHTDGKEYAYLRAWTTNPGNSAGYHGLELGVPPADAGGPAKHLMFATNYALRMVLLNNGNVGIGTTDPAAQLHVKTANFYALRLEGAQALQTFNHTNGEQYAYLRAWTTNPTNAAGYHGLELGVPPAVYNAPGKHLMFSTNDALRMVILNDGNVGIGTINPTHKLAVNGTIRAKELIVETGWADFVFAKNYRLRPLREVERFIQTHHHLPDVASASTIQQQGVAIADATTKLMQKVEELTLYAIRQDKELRRMQQQLNAVSRSRVAPKPRKP